MKIKELLEGPYEDGVNDGKRGHRNPRASSIYGPSSDHYEKGYQHGVTLGKKEGEANVRRYEEWLKPFSHLSNEELHDLAEKFRRSPEDRMANGQPYPYNSKFQAIHQVLGQRRHNPNYGLDAKHGVAESASAGATSSASIASVPNPNYANNANKKPVKSVSALDQNSVSLFGAPMETMKNKTGKKLAIIKRR